MSQLDPRPHVGLDLDRLLTDRVMCRRPMTTAQVLGRLRAVADHLTVDLDTVARRLELLRGRGVVQADIDPTGVRATTWWLIPPPEEP